MMTPPDPDARFLAALGRAAAARLGEDHALVQAAADATRDPAPEKGAAVRDLLDSVPADDRDRILAETHRAMREDLSAIWSLLPGAGQAGGMH